MSGYIYTAGTSFSYLDSPSSTSSLTYKVQFKSNGGENFVTDNGSTGNNDFTGGISIMTL